MPAASATRAVKEWAPAARAGVVNDQVVPTTVAVPRRVTPS